MILLYGASGYTGALVARALVAGGVRPVLAGRDPRTLAPVADDLGLDVRVGTLERIDLAGATALLNCAGPFAVTQRTLLDACLGAEVHYLDLAGEVGEHAPVAALDEAARAAGILALPGAGFGIVPSACLLAHTVARVADPVRATLAIKTVGGVSRGTAEVVLGNLRSPGVQRVDGRLVPTRAGAVRRRLDFDDGDGPTTVVTNPWRADLVAAAPGIPTLTTLMAFPAPVRALIRVPHGGLLRAAARRLPAGPSDAAIAKGRTALLAEVTGRDGGRARGVLHGPDAYAFTAAAALACARRVLAGDAPAGHHTAASAWGADFAAGIDGVTVADLGWSAPPCCGYDRASEAARPGG